MIRHLALLLVLALLASLNAAPAYAQDNSGQEKVAETGGREILVMLKVPPGHIRPNSSYAGRYGDTASQSARIRQARNIGLEHKLELVESWPMPLVGVDCFVMRILDDRTADEVVAQLSNDRSIAWSQPLNLYYTMASKEPPNDPLYLAQPTAKEWQLATLHQAATGKGVKVAVIDSQVDLDHPDLAGQILTAKNFVSQGGHAGEPHGTGVAGVISALGDNGLGIVGIAPKSKLLALRACREDHPNRSNVGRAACDSLSLAKALHFALDNGADIINLSLAGPQDRLLKSLIELGLDRNIAIVTAFDPERANGGFPASIPGVLPIADETLPSPPANVYRAPGRSIPTTRPGGKWGLVSGSSFATANVSGLVALVEERSRKPRNQRRVVRSPGGVVDACATLFANSHECGCSCSSTGQAE